MKLIAIFIAGILVGFLAVYSLCVTDNMPIDCCTGVVIEPTDSMPTEQGVKIDATQSITLMNNFELNYLKPALHTERLVAGCYGGRISTQALINILTDTRQTGEFVNFRFGYETGTLTVPSTEPTPAVTLADGKVFLILSKSPLGPGAVTSPEDLIIRTGTNYESFCPLMCPID